MRYLVLGLLVLGLVGCGSSGKPAPAFTIEDVRGEIITGESLLGKVVLIDFWASWCGPCMKAAPIMQNLHRELGDRGLVVLGVNINDPRSDAGSIKSYAETKNLTYRMAWKADSFADRLGVESLPTFILLDKRGRIRQRMNGLSSSAERELHDAIVALLKE